MENTKKVIDKLKEGGKKTQVNFMLVFRKLYNKMCRSCQVGTYKMIQRKSKKGDPPSYNDFKKVWCDSCLQKAKDLEEEANEVLK